MGMEEMFKWDTGKIESKPNIDSVKENIYEDSKSEILEKYSKARDLEIKKRFESMEEYRNQFVGLVNDVLGIDEDIIETSYESSVRGRPYYHERESDIVLKAISKYEKYTYILVEAQTSKDYYIFDRLLYYYLMMNEKLFGNKFHDIKTIDNAKEIYRDMGLPVFVVINTGKDISYIKNRNPEVVEVLDYKDFRSQFDNRYMKYGTINFKVVCINDSLLNKLGNKYMFISEYAKLMANNDVNRMIRALNLTEEEAVMLKEGLNYKDKYKLVFEGIKEEGREEGIEKVYKDAIRAGINPMSIGCPRETYERLVKEIGNNNL